MSTQVVGFGKFKRIVPPKNSKDCTDFWRHKAVTISVTDEYYGGSDGDVTKVKRNGRLVFEGTSDVAHEFLLKRYGINDEA